MGCMLRSDAMSLYDLFIQPEAAFEILTHLGNTSCVQFLDMNPNIPAFHRSYVTEVCRCSEMERKLRYLDEQLDISNIAKARMIVEPKPLQPKEMLPLENVLEKLEVEISEMTANYAGLMKLYLEMSELYFVLDKVGPMLGEAEIRNAMWPPQFVSSKEGKQLNDLRSEYGGQLMVLTGVIKATRSFPFQMMLWRLSHGNIYYRQSEDERVFKDASGQKERRAAFLIVCQGKEIHDRLLKVCSGFRVNLYPCPTTDEERRKMKDKVSMNIADQEKVLHKTRYGICKALVDVSLKLILWKTSVRKAKAIYHNMNLFNLDITKKFLIGRCWIPDNDVPKVKQSLKFYSDRLGSNVESFIIKAEKQDNPPTYHRTNKFTNGFQALINAYGESSYRELNPGPTNSLLDLLSHLIKILLKRASRNYKCKKKV